jgi:hypothetical protein
METPGLRLLGREIVVVEADLLIPEMPVKTVDGAVKADPGWEIAGNSRMLSSAFGGGHDAEEMRASEASREGRWERERDWAMRPERASAPPRLGGADGRWTRRGGGRGPFDWRTRPGLGGGAVSAAILAFHSRSARRAVVIDWR